MSAPTATASPAGQTTFNEGYKSQLIVGTAIYYVTDFEFEQVFDTHPTTTTSNPTGVKMEVLGLKQVTFTGKANFDLTASPFTTLQTGSTVAITWYGDCTASSPSPTFYGPTCNIKSAKVTDTAENIITVDFSGETTGTYTVA